MLKLSNNILKVAVVSSPSSNNLNDTSNNKELQNQIDVMKIALGNYSRNILNMNPNNSNTILNEMFAIQIGPMQNNSLSNDTNLNQYSISNKLSLIDFSNCESKLRQFYNLSHNSTFLLKKLDFNSELNLKLNDNFLGSNSTQFELFLTDNLQKINLSICDEGISYKIPLKNPNRLNMSRYFSLASPGIDIFDSNSVAFKTRCFPHVDPSTGADSSIVYRINSYYDGRSVFCGIGCTYKGLDKNNYSLCVCNQSKINSSEVSHQFNYDPLAVVSTINFDIIECYQLPWKSSIFSNPGFYLNILTFFLIIIVIGLFEFLNKDFAKDEMFLKEIILTDAVYFDKDKMNMKLYFLYPKLYDKVKIFIKNPKILLTKNIKSFDVKSDMVEFDPEKLTVNNSLKVSDYTYNFNEFYEIQGHKLITKLYKNNKIFTHEFCYNDYNQLSPFDAVMYDKRSFFKLYIDDLRENHIILTIFLKNSLLYPKWIRIIWLLYNISLTFFLNGLLFTDGYIDNRIMIPKNSRNSFFYEIQYEFPKTFVSVIISTILMSLIKFLIKVPIEISKKFNEAVLTKDINSIAKANLVLKGEMKIRYILTIITSLIVYFFCFYYVIIFCSVYTVSSSGWAYGSIWGIIINFVIIGLIIPIIKSSIRIYNRTNFSFVFILYLELLLQFI